MELATSSNDLRYTLAEVLAGTKSPLALDNFPIDEVLTYSQAQGVSALLANCLGLSCLESNGRESRRLETNIAEPGNGKSGDRYRPLALRVQDLMKAELAQRAELRRAISALELAGIQPLVLKGLALGQWLYAAGYLRECSDIDLLFANRKQAETAAEVLKVLGYVMPYRPGHFAHELLCRKSGSRVDLDLHWALTAYPVLDHLPPFGSLLASAIPLPSFGASALGLSPVNALLHACVHRASNLGAGLGDRLKWLCDIHLLSTCFAVEDWASFVIVTRDSRVSGMALSGLRASQSLFATSLPSNHVLQMERNAEDDALDAGRLSDWRYVQLRNFSALGLASKIRWMWGRAFPPAGYLRELYGRDLGWRELMRQRMRRLRARLND